MGALPFLDTGRVPFTVLFVCTGNICRSPTAELLMRAWADPRAEDFEVHSAGMRALVGHGIDPGTATALEQLGIDPTSHRARQFEPRMATDSDLILTAERAHRDAVMTAVPASFRQVFTLKEFARLAPYVRPGPAVDVVAQAAVNRVAVGGVPVEDDDLPDPYRRSAQRASSIAEQVGESVRSCLDMLGVSPRSTNSRTRPYAT